jgi:RNA polymerase sigma factor (sigma-70 family)
MAANDWADAGLQPLLDRHAAGDESAANELIGRLAKELGRMARARMRDEEKLGRYYQEEDVAQELAIRLRQALAAKKPRTPEELKGLAYRKLNHVLLDLWKHQFGEEGSGRHHAAPPPQQAEGRTGHGHMPERADSEIGPATEVRGRDLLARMRAALPPEHREVFDLVIVAELPEEEAAGRLNVSVSTVRRRKRAALRQLGRMKAALGAG